MKEARLSPPPPFLASGLLRQHLDGFRQDQLTVHALGGHKAHLTGGGEQLVQALEGAALAVGDPVVAEITEGNGLGAGGDKMCIRDSEEDAEILNPLAVMLETEQDTVGAERSMLFRVTVVEAVMVPIDLSLIHIWSCR